MMTLCAAWLREVDVGFMNKSYPEGKLKEDLSKRDKHLIKSIVARIAYTQFIDKQQEYTDCEQEQ